MNLKALVTPALAVALMSGSAAFAQGYGAPAATSSRLRSGRPGWMGCARRPSSASFRQRGFHDGVEGARKDFENHRAPNPNNRDEFRHPNVPHEMRRDYRDGFRKGYFAAVRHMQGGPGPYGGPR